MSSRRTSPALEYRHTNHVDSISIMATKATPRRASQETEHRHLLAPSGTTTPAATSVVDLSTGGRTPRARSPASDEGYRGFASKAAYLEALQQWADEKKYLEPDTGLQGFYGTVTMEEYARRPGLKVEGLGLRRKVKGWRERREGKGDGGRR